MHVLISVLAWCAVGALVLAAALRIDRSALERARSNPGPIVRTLAVVWIAVPVVAMIVTALLRVPRLGATTLLLMAIAPGVPLVMRSGRKITGRADASLLIVLAVAVTAPVLVPIWAAIYQRVYDTRVTIGAGRVLTTLLPTVFAPIAAGVAIRAMSEPVAKKLARLADKASLVGLLVLLVLVIVGGAPLLLHVAPRTFVAAAVITGIAAALGYVAGGASFEDRATSSLVAAMGNPAIAIAILSGSRADLHPGALVAAYVLVRALSMIPVQVALRRERTRHSSDGDECATHAGVA